ncbi:MAG: caspase family protein [Magnetococcales bacterium]|nr:caspase family protein [Magnetococcales bacterium]
MSDASPTFMERENLPPPAGHANRCATFTANKLQTGWLLIVMFLLSVLLRPAIAMADIYGIVVGINQYQSMPLDGPVNDARDIADALKKVGAREVNLLLDGQAKRDNILKTWHDVLQKSKANDLIVFTYAGHGGIEPEHFKGSEPSGNDSTLLLGGFFPKGEGTYERIIDDEIAGLLKKATDGKRSVIVVADACHSGTMTRSLGNNSPVKLKVRAATYPPVVDDRLPPLDPKLNDLPKEFPDVLYFGAVKDDELAPEGNIEGNIRGALSWAFAKGLRGEADLNNDGTITSEELRVYVTEKVKTEMEGMQHPQSSGKTRDFTLNVKKEPPEPRSEPAAQGTPVPSSSPPLIGLAILNATTPVGELGKKIHGIKLIDPNSGQRPDLTWDLSRGLLFTDLGDVASTINEKAATDQASATRGLKRSQSATPAATGDETADLPNVQNAVDKYGATEEIKRLITHNTLKMSLLPDDKLHRAGEKITFKIEGFDKTFFTLFNLASDGSVNFLYPLANAQTKDPLEIPLGKPYLLNLNVDPPFGADHIVAIASPTPLTALHQALRQMDGQKLASKIPDLLRKNLTGTGWQMGIHGLYTGDKQP